MTARIKSDPVTAFSGLLLSLLLAACGGGGGGGGSPAGGVPSGGSPTMNITPPGGGGNTGVRFYGALDYAFRGSDCSAGYAAGVATGYASEAAARAAAIRQCRGEGGADCGPDVTQFGSAYSGGNLCAAVAYGETARACRLSNGRGATAARAAAAALAECRSGGYSCATVTTACSASGPQRSFARTGGGGSGGTPSVGPVEGGSPTGGNRPPSIGVFPPLTVQQGRTRTYESISSSDPDGDRLEFTARSSRPDLVSVRISGRTLEVRGVRSFTGGTVTVTVTARDPGGLTASETIAVTVIPGSTGGPGGGGGGSPTGGPPPVVNPGGGTTPVDPPPVGGTLPLASTCVSSRNAGFDTYGDYYELDVEFTNNCGYEADVLFRYLIGGGTTPIRCSSGGLIDLDPGESETVGMGPIPRGTTQRWSSCIQYSASAVQRRTGYRSCTESGRPACP